MPPPLLVNIDGSRENNIVPDKGLISEATHVAIAFVLSEAFNQVEPMNWLLFTSVNDVPSKLAPGTNVMIAIGEWGDTDGFDVAAATEDSRKLFALNVAKMVEATGADGTCARLSNFFN